MASDEPVRATQWSRNANTGRQTAMTAMQSRDVWLRPRSSERWVGGSRKRGRILRNANESRFVCITQDHLARLSSHFSAGVVDGGCLCMVACSYE